MADRFRVNLDPTMHDLLEGYHTRVDALDEIVYANVIYYFKHHGHKYKFEEFEAFIKQSLNKAQNAAFREMKNRVARYTSQLLHEEDQGIQASPSDHKERGSAAKADSNLGHHRRQSSDPVIPSKLSQEMKVDDNTQAGVDDKMERDNMTAAEAVVMMFGSS